MRTNQKHFVIRTNPTSPTQILRYLGIFIDKWDYGVDLGNKDIRHCNSRITMDGFIFNKNIKPKIRNRYKLNSKKINDHMTNVKTYYYTSNPFSRYMLCCPEVDNRTDDKTRTNPFLQLLTSHFPDIFYDRGSSGKSLHPYLKLDMLPLYDYHLFDSGDNRTYPKFANEIFSQISSVLKTYGHYFLAPEQKLIKNKSKYCVEHDAIKGTYPDYDFFYYKKTGKYVITKVINHGVLVKLPRLTTPDDYQLFYSSRVYSILDFLCFAIYLGSSLLLSSCGTVEQRLTVEQYLSNFETILMAHSVFIPCQEKNSVALISSIIKHGPSNSNYCLGKSRFQAKNKDFGNLKEYDCNANIRRIAVIQKCCRKYYLEHHILPTDEYLERHYREHPASTGQADLADIREIKEVCQFVKQGFNKDLVKETVKYEQLMFIPHIKDVFNKEHYKEILKDTAAKKCRPNNIMLDLYAGYIYTCLSSNKELTLSSYNGFKTFVKKFNITVDDNICLACRLLFEHYRWLEKLDADYEIPYYENGKKVDGKGMAYALTEHFPFFAEFEKAVGKSNIDKVRAKGMVSLEDWDSMGNTG